MSMRRKSPVRQGQRPANHFVRRRTTTPATTSQEVPATCKRDSVGRLYDCTVVPKPPPSRWRAFWRAADEAAPAIGKFADITVRTVRGVRKP